MSTIFQANLNNEDGMGLPIRTEYFEDESDAKCFAFGPSLVKHPRNTNSVNKIILWQKGEYSQDDSLRLAALAKLTDKEKELLGLTNQTAPGVSGE